MPNFIEGIDKSTGKRPTAIFVQEKEHHDQINRECQYVAAIRNGNIDDV